MIQRLSVHFDNLYSAKSSGPETPLQNASGIPDGSRIPIEQRDGGEVASFAGVQTGPAEVHTWNPSFDVTPHELLTAAITERGVLYPPFGQNLCRLFQET